MATVEERLSSLETRMDAMTDLRALIVDLRGDMNRQFSEMRSDITELRGDLNRRIDLLDDKHDRHFTWLVGFQMALMVAVIGTLVGSYYR